MLQQGFTKPNRSAEPPVITSAQQKEPLLSVPFFLLLTLLALRIKGENPDAANFAARAAAAVREEQRCIRLTGTD